MEERTGVHNRKQEPRNDVRNYGKDIFRMASCSSWLGNVYLIEMSIVHISYFWCPPIFPPCHPASWYRDPPETTSENRIDSGSKCLSGKAAPKKSWNLHVFPTCQRRSLDSRFIRVLLLFLLNRDSRSQWALPDLNRELQISVGTSGPQPRAPDARSRSQPDARENVS